MAAGDAHEYPIYGANYRVTFPLFDADGDLVTGAAGLDSEVSKDSGTFSDCTNEATEIATSSGMYYLDLTGAEMTASVAAVIVKTSTSGAKTTPVVLYPKRTAVLESGTAQAGASTTITLASGASAKDSYYNGLYVLITNNSPAGAQYQARRVLSYVGSTRVATVESAWGTNPSSASTYDVLVPDTMGVAAWAGVKLSDPAAAGVPDVNAKNVNNQTAPTLTGDAYARLGAPAGASVSADIAAVKANLPAQVKKNTALSNFEFVMFDSTDHVTPKTGLTITAQRSIDGAAFASCANSASELSNGVYKINLAAADLNGDVVTLRFTATGADPTLITVVTNA